MSKIYVLIIILVSTACSSGLSRKQSKSPETKTIIDLNINGKGPEISLELFQGESFYYPLMAAWIEDENGQYIQTLFVSESVATGRFRYGKQENGKWIPAVKRAPQSLPYWAHKRGVVASDGLFMPEPDNPVPDAYSGETPTQSFILNTKADQKLPDTFRVLFEINQNWDWNYYWTNNKYPEDENYKLSCQPALIFEALINTNKPEKVYSLKLIGHSHYSGKTGELFTDLSTFTTALDIVDSILVKIK